MIVAAVGFCRLWFVAGGAEVGCCCCLLRCVVAGAVCWLLMRCCFAMLLFGVFGCCRCVCYLCVMIVVDCCASLVFVVCRRCWC